MTHLTDPEMVDLLDESLTVLDGLWSGKTFSFHGSHFDLEPVRFLPRPVSRPRIPVWVGGVWPAPRPMERAARWDGGSWIHSPLSIQTRSFRGQSISTPAGIGTMQAGPRWRADVSLFLKWIWLCRLYRRVDSGDTPPPLRVLWSLERSRPSVVESLSDSRR